MRDKKYTLKEFANTLVENIKAKGKWVEDNITKCDICSDDWTILRDSFSVHFELEYDDDYPETSSYIILDIYMDGYFDEEFSERRKVGIVWIEAPIEKLYEMAILGADFLKEGNSFILDNEDDLNWIGWSIAGENKKKLEYFPTNFNMEESIKLAEFWKKTCEKVYLTDYESRKKYLYKDGRCELLTD